MRDTLFDTSPVIKEHRSTQPIVVVGLPRSGSSYLSHILSQFKNYYVFDDLYLIRKAKELGVGERFTQAQMDAMLFFLGWQIRARLRFGSYAIPNVAEDEVEAMNDALKEMYQNSPPTVLELQEEWMTRLAHRSGAQKWGFKMPGAFRNLEEILAFHPDAKVIFLMRQPHDVLSSYKNMPKTSQDGNPERYHPIPYAIYWRMAAKSLCEWREKRPDQVFFVNFKELVADPQGTCNRLGSFLSETPPETVSTPEKPNTSHVGNDKRRKGINGLETWIVNTACGGYIKKLGFQKQTRSMALSDLGDLLSTSMTFSKFHIGRALKRS